VLGELNLELAFPRVGTPGEDVQNQGYAVEHFHPEGVLEVALLERRKLVIEYNHVIPGGAFQCLEFLQLSSAYIVRLFGNRQSLDKFTDDFGAGRNGKLSKLFQRVLR
jgi:hypothetical protein